MVDTTVELANKVGAAEIVVRVVDDLKDENEQYRKMVRMISLKYCPVFPLYSDSYQSVSF